MSLLELSMYTICMQVYLAPVRPEPDYTQRPADFWTSAPKTWSNSRANRSTGNWTNKWAGKSAGKWPNRWNSKSNWTKTPSGNWSSSWQTRWPKNQDGNWGNRRRSNWTKNWGKRSYANRVSVESYYARESTVVSTSSSTFLPTTTVKKRTRKRSTKTKAIEPTASQLEGIVRSKFKKHGIVPDIIPVAPEHEIEVSLVFSL